MTTRDAHGARSAVVVGDDGSEHSKQALAWGARYAALVGAPLRVIAVWRLPTGYGWPLPVPGEWDPEGDARDVLDREVTEVFGPKRPDTLSFAVVEGPPGRVLVDESDHASLVVVGSRGRGAFAGMLLGSVSEFVTTHAHCPVVVVRNSAED
ncbi:MAG TPA: universal stress protein [Acidimicrobiales bacterium]|nr:universal stress protein [Acidimicrobiales bacterium]